MREFKFRGWHEGLPAKGSFKGVSAQMLYDEKIGDVFRWKSEGQPIKVMQFTGLQDKHGIDIYEGDICLTSHNDNITIGFKNIGFSFYGYEAHELEIIGNIHEQK